ncbi:MAG TPA: hypothetical protein VGM16_05410 [Gammaproteobacteria bacterium]|jgi:hypothetical protein
MHRLCVRLLLALSLALSLGAAEAADFDYDWLSGGLMRNYPGGIVEDGWFVDGSVAVSSQFTLQGDFYRLKYDQNLCLGTPGGLNTGICFGQSSRWDYLRLGAGWHLAMTDSADLLADAYYARDKNHDEVVNTVFAPGITCPANGFAIPGGCAEETTHDVTGSGYLLDVGVRVRCSCALEFKGYLGHVSVGGGFGASNFVRAEGAWQFANHWALVLDARHYSSPSNQYRLGMRYLF